MSDTINDTFDNLSFTTSGHCVIKDVVLKHGEQSYIIDKETPKSINPKASFDDTAYINDSFSLSQMKELSNIVKDFDHIQTNLDLKEFHLAELNGTVDEGKNVDVSRLHETTNIIRSMGSLNSFRTSHTKFETSCNSGNQNRSNPDIKSQVIKTSQPSYKLSCLGLPPEILQKYECRGITQMFQWQYECLSCNGVLEYGRNLIYSAPTSAGKTLVAEILGIKTVLEQHKKVIFILPFVSVVREKMFYFQDIFGTSGIRVEGFMGNYNPPGGFRSVNVAICTIEKANSIVNRLIEEGKLNEIGSIIVDELHLLGDSSRGYLLELMLTKLRFMARKDESAKFQIVGMSATLPNLDLLGKWLDAELYVTSFRPVPLNEQYQIDGDIYTSAFSKSRKLDAMPELETDTDNVLQLCLETLLESCSVLIFCPTKNWCENLGVQIANAFYKLGSSMSPIGMKLREQILPEPIIECLEQLKRTPGGLDHILQKTVSFGVAFHHAGLTMEERDIVEAAFRSGAIRVLVATSTLSSGVNLPARRVIIRSATFFGKPIDILSYKQMVGRAGRMGKDTMGESILICKKNEADVARQLISGELEPICSCLEGSGRLKRALLEIIAAGVVSTLEEIEQFAGCTLLNEEGNMSNENPIMDCVDFLVKFQFVRLQKTEDGSHMYVATPLAKACLSSSMPPEEGLELFAELEKARQCFVLDTDLHLIYLVTPFSAHITNIDWMRYLDIYEKLPASMKRVAEIVGVKISFIIACSSGRTPKTSSKLAIYSRFYTALALQDLVNEVPLNEVCKRFSCNRGVLQRLQLSASSFAGMVTTFSKQLGWASVELLISQFQDRLQFGVSRELLDLMRLPLLNAKRARTLFNSGIESLVDLAACEVFDLENILHKAEPFESNEREGETKYDSEKRNQLRTIFITGRQGLTVFEAAKLLIEDARKYLQYEIGVHNANWSIKDENSKIGEVTTLENNSQKVQNSQNIQMIVNDVSIKEQEMVLQNNEEANSLCDKNVNLCIDPINDSLNTSELVSKEVVTKNLLNVTDKIDKHEKSCKPESNNDVSWNNTLITDAFVDSFNTSLQIEEKKCSIVDNLDDSYENGKKPRLIIDNLNDSLKVDMEQSLFLESFNKSLQLEQKPNSFLNDDVISDEIYSSDDDFKAGSILTIGQRSKFTSKNEVKFEILKVCENSMLYNAFFDELIKQSTISISLGCEEHNEEKQLIGLRRSIIPNAKYCWKAVKIVGIALYWPTNDDMNTTYYIDLDKFDSDMDKLSNEILRKKLLIFNAKEQLKLFHCCLNWSINNVVCEDPKIADWLLDPEGFEKDIRKMVALYTPENNDYLKFVDQISRNNEGFGLDAKSEVGGKLRSCLEVFLNWNITKGVINRLKDEDPKFIDCFEFEMKIIAILSRMEITGFPVDLQKLQSFADTLKAHTQSIEKEAYNIAGRRFSMTSSTAISKVLQLSTKTKRRPSTNKKVLAQCDHPIADLIMQWRKINGTLTNIVYPLLRLIENGRIHGSSVTHNSTGRISMHEPNIQTVPRDFQYFDVITNKTHDITLRTAFGVSNLNNQLVIKKVIVGADYCQLELRILAHLSKDVTLCRIMRTEGDIFKTIASEWMKIEENEVDDKLRQKTKHICYGIIYGMGLKSLAEQMNVTEDEAFEFTETFHSTYPGLRIYMKKVLESCRQDGYVETLHGRRRYLPSIESNNDTERSKAERQAVNTTIQGSAADITKKAMILIDQKVQEKFRNSRNVPKLILHLHDELLYEVPQKYEDIFCVIIRKCMQDSTKLSVPLPIKLQSGESWGSLIIKDNSKIIK